MTSRAWIAALIALSAGCENGDPPSPAADAGIGTTPGTTVEVLRPITLTEQARLPEQDPHLVDVEVGEDTLAFVYDGPIAPIPFAVGDVVAGVLHDGYLRRLTSIAQPSPDRIEVTTAHAELGELIGDGHFRVSFAPGTATGDLAPSGDVGLAGEALTTGWSGITPEVRSLSCSGTAGGSLTIEPRFDIDLGMDLEIDIQWTSRFLIPRGELRAAVFALRGEVEAGVIVRTTTNLSASCSINLLDLIRRAGGRIPQRKWSVTFAVGPVPVIVTHTIEPYAQVQSSVEVETGRTTMVAVGRMGIRAGVQFDQADGWRPIWMPTHSGDVRVTPSENGRITISSGISAGLRYGVKLYDTVGPSVALGPQVSGMVAAPGDCTYTADASLAAQLTGSIDVSVPFTDWQLASLSVSGNLAETSLAHSTGTWPWCDDAGVDGGLDAGMIEMDGGPAIEIDAGPPEGGIGEAGSDAAPSDAGPLPNGAPCTAAIQCRSRYCTDGVCCNTGCTGECMSCVAATSRSPDGTCDAIREDTDPDDECPMLQTCQAFRDTAGATAYCNAHLGDPCTGPGMCPSAGFCRDGVCCNLSTCGTTAPCTACRMEYTGMPDGTCTAVLPRLDPHDYCSLPGSVCNGASSCCLLPGTGCTRSIDCCSASCNASGVCD